MDDLIYVIALIAWVVFAFYRKSQKKAGSARETRPQPQTRDESGPLPTLEEILLGREPVPEPETEPVPVPTAAWTEGMSPVLSKTAFEKEYNRQGITSIEELDKPMTIGAEKQADIHEDEVPGHIITALELRRDFDLRRAVIYAEILNRPYV